MSNYRDDALESLRLSDQTWIIVKATNANEVLRLNDIAFATITVKHNDQFSLGDSYNDSSVLNAYDHFTLSDTVSGQRISTKYLVDQFILKDKVMSFQWVIAEDQIQLADKQTSRVRAHSADEFNLLDHINGQKYAIGYAQDRFKISDLLSSIYQEQVIDSLLIEDFTQSKLYATEYVIDQFVLDDQELSVVQMQNQIVDSLKLGDATQGRLIARDQNIDCFALYDEIKDSALHGQAWTANTETWAMSRYMPYAFNGLTVIDHQLYGWNDQGVFLMDTPTQNIDGFIQTGKLDFGENLVHPIAAYLEYEMSGENKQLDISITTTQSGQAAKYTYMLPNETADHLTNGRVIFGRGLRGRHFSFGISITAQSMKMNSLSVEFTQTARRV